MPSTPTTSSRSKAAIFGLEAISRNLFNPKLGSSKVDIFGGSVNSHRRTKSAGSRSSMYTQTTSTRDGSLAVFSHRSNSTATVATTLSVSDDEFFASKSPQGTKRSKGRKSISEAGVSPTRRLSKAISRSKSANNTDVEKSDSEDESTAMVTHYMDDSERDLARRLDLARRNSESQHNKPVPPLPVEASVEDTIYEGRSTFF
jgi:protein ECT2